MNMDTDIEYVRGGYKVRGHKKGGGGSRTPVESPDSLKSTSYAKVLDLISEGEIGGLVNGMQSVYLNGTPLQNADGSMNFQGVTLDFRYGTQHQSYIQGIPASERTESVGLEIRYGSPWVKTFSGRELSAIRLTLGTNGLSKINTSSGDVTGHVVPYKVELQTGSGPWKTVVDTAFRGKTTSSYRRAHRIDLPESDNGWTIRVTRTSPNSTSSSVADDFRIDLFAEVIDVKMRYPMLAIAGITVDASQFTGGVPTRGYDVYLRKIRVPSNYDPINKVYTGVWDGSFKIAWSDCPAWVLYDMLTNDLFGLGDIIPANYIDKYELYNIGRYCDEKVPDGRGGMEARFACNVYFQQEAPAYKVLQDLVSVFRGMIFWGAGTAVTVADMPKDYSDTYTQANVVDGKFVYTGARLSDMYTSVLVSYMDATDGYRQKVITVSASDEIVNKYGYRPTEVTAFACASEGQAWRLGKWVLAVSHECTRAVSFSTGLEGAFVTPGEIIRVADNLIAGRRLGGRVVKATIDSVQIETDIVVANGDTITVTLPDGTTETREVISARGRPFTVDSLDWSADGKSLASSGEPWTADWETYPPEGIERKIVRVSPPFSAVPVEESVWVVESVDLASQLFTVKSITEGSVKGTYEISAVQHVPGLYDSVDHGTSFDERPITVVPPSVQVPVNAVKLEAYNIVSQGISEQVAAINWDAAEGAEYYNVEWSRDDSDWVKAGQIYTTLYEIKGAYAGIYRARVQAVDSLGTPSVWTVSPATPLEGILQPPPSVTNLTAKPLVMGIDLAWGFPDGRNIIEKTELWYSQTNDRNAAIRLGDFAYPQASHQMLGLAPGATFWFWARCVDKNGTVGAWFPAGNGVVGQASSDAGLLLDYLNGEITETQLAEQLLEKIDSGGGASVEVEAIKTALAAMYTIKTQLTVDGVPYMAGIGVGVENNDGVITSQILLAAQRVAVLNEVNGTTTTPFVIQDGNVYMNSAIIGKASIGSAQIADWLESDAKGPDGFPVFRVNMRTGELMLNASTGGGRMLLDNTGMRLFDGNGTERITIRVTEEAP